MAYHFHLSHDIYNYIQHRLYNFLCIFKSCSTGNPEILTNKSFHFCTEGSDCIGKKQVFIYQCNLGRNGGSFQCGYPLHKQGHSRRNLVQLSLPHVTLVAVSQNLSRIRMSSAAPLWFKERAISKLT